VDEMIPATEVRQLIRTEVAAATAELRASLEQAKRHIAMLNSRLYGTRAETSQVVLSAEGQQIIDPAWGVSPELSPAPLPPGTEAPARPVRPPRDRRGLAQRHPQLPIVETDAALPAELAEQVAAGALAARRGGFRDELVVPEVKPFIRRVYATELVKPGTDAAVLKITPDRIVPDGDLADETIHGLVEGKALDATPFTRQLDRLERAGVEIPKQTVNDAVNTWGEVFAPLAQAIIAQVLASDVVHADASWLRLQAEIACKRLHLWTLVGGGQVGYLITEDQRHDRAAELIPPDFRGRLMTDAWPGWLKLPLGDRHGLCNAHARRPFADWLKRDRHNPHAQRIVELYRRLARIEHRADDGPPESRLDRLIALRQQDSAPLMAEIRTEAERIATAYPHAHQLADGARYILDYWDGLTRFLAHPALPMDNNAAENALRINALIRKNSLFNGSLAAAHRDAVALTVFHACRLQGLTPSRYLARVTPVLLLHRAGRKQDLHALTPAAVAKSG
jgi:hypothetical protein